MQLLPFAKSCPGSAADFYCIPSCWCIIVCCRPCWGWSLAALKTSCFWKRLDKGFKKRNHLFFSLNAVATFSQKKDMPQLVVFYCMSCCWFIIVCCRPCWGEALLPWKKAVFESFWIRVLNKETTFAFLWMQLLPFPKKQVCLSWWFFYCMSCCWFIIVCCRPCWGEALLPWKKTVFESFWIRVLNKETTFAFLWMQVLLFQKIRYASAGGFLLHVLLLVYNCLL